VLRNQLQMQDVQLQDLYERYASASAREAEKLLSAVTSYIQPVLARIVSQQMQGRTQTDQEDVCSLTMAIIIRKIQDKREKKEQIVDLRAYLVTVAKHEILRYCHSLQAQLKTTISIETFERPGDHQDGPAKTPDSLQARDTTASVIQREYLRAVWETIRQFPPRQCAALLLQGSDPNGTSMVELLEMCRIASHREMAQAMGMTSEEFGIWREEIPVTDATIATRYGQPAQSIARLRMMARRKLEEQMRASDTSAITVQAMQGGKV